MTLEKIRAIVAESRSDTLVAKRFREAVGVECRTDHDPNTISEKQYRERIKRRDIMACMAQRVGALDRVRG